MSKCILCKGSGEMPLSKKDLNKHRAGVIKSLRKKGYTYQEIADIYRVAISTIQYWEEKK